MFLGSRESASRTKRTASPASPSARWSPANATRAEAAAGYRSTTLSNNRPGFAALSLFVLHHRQVDACSRRPLIGHGASIRLLGLFCLAHLFLGITEVVPSQAVVGMLLGKVARIRSATSPQSALPPCICFSSSAASATKAMVAASRSGPRTIFSEGWWPAAVSGSSCSMDLGCAAQAAKNAETVRERISSMRFISSSTPFGRSSYCPSSPDPRCGRMSAFALDIQLALRTI